MSRVRNYCFTLNNYTPAEEEHLRQLGQDVTVKYIVFGREVGESGTPHLQGFICFVHARKLAGVKTLIGQRAHLEPMRGTFKQAADYCKKDDDFEEFGHLPLDQAEKGAVEKERWDEVKALAQQNRLEEIESQVYIKHYSTLKRIARDFMKLPGDLDNHCGVWIYGASGIGKSRYVRHHYPEFFHKMPNKWWDGYQDHANVLVDDVDPTHKYLAYYLKIWMDRYAFPCETKGSSIMIRPARIIVTSQYTIEQVFDETDAVAVRRRCEVIHMVFPFVPPAVPIVPSEDS